MDTPIPATSGKGPVANLALRRAAGEIHADPVQEKVVARLQVISDQFAAIAGRPPQRFERSARQLGVAALQHEVIDVGTCSTESVDYPDIAFAVAGKVGALMRR